MITDAVRLWRVLAQSDPRLWELIHPHSPPGLASRGVSECLGQARQMVRVAGEQSLIGYSLSGEVEAMRPLQVLAESVRERVWPSWWPRPLGLPEDDKEAFAMWRGVQAQCALGLSYYGAALGRGGPSELISEEVEALASAATWGMPSAEQSVVRVWELWGLVRSRPSPDELAPDVRDALYPPEAWDAIVPHQGPFGELSGRAIAVASTMDPIPVGPGLTWQTAASTFGLIPFREWIRVEVQVVVRQAVHEAVMRAASYTRDGATAEAAREIDMIQSRVRETLEENERAAMDALEQWRLTREVLDRFREGLQRIHPRPLPDPGPWRHVDPGALVQERLVSPLLVFSRAAVDLAYYAYRVSDAGLGELLTQATHAFMVSALEEHPAA